MSKGPISDILKNVFNNSLRFECLHCYHSWLKYHEHTEVEKSAPGDVVYWKRDDLWSLWIKLAYKRTWRK